ncbi:MAG: hypothetical protein AAF267_15235 [Deinococcota bacterium]
MIKLVAIGDVHGLWGTVWRILRAASAVDADGKPTPPVLEGRMHIIFIGDLVHYKDAAGYAKAIGVDVYDPTDSEQLVRAAKTQIRDLRRFKSYMDAAAGNVTDQWSSQSRFPGC